MFPFNQSARRATAAGLALAVGAGLLAGCTAASGAAGPTEVRFNFSKREAIDFMGDLIADYHASQDKYRVMMDTSGIDPLQASFVRGNPPDLALTNYNMESARYIQRDVLRDLSGTKAAQNSREDLLPVMHQYGYIEGKTSALPYSVMAAGVIYNKAIFRENGVEVPQTWSELLDVCERLQAAGVTPFYATLKDDWTAGQGWYDYSIGGMVDVLDFYDRLAEQGTDVGPDSPVSFSKDFKEPLDKVLELKKYMNPDADSRGYGDGNLAFAQGKAAMYLQGPWAFSEIAKTDPDLELGGFPLPMTEDPEDNKVRINVDLAAWIPEEASNPEGAFDFLEYLFQSDVMDAYNASQLGFAPTEDAAPVTDDRIEGLVPYYDAGRTYLGATQLVPQTIPIQNYAQGILLGQGTDKILGVIDADWARVAFRAPKLDSDKEA